MITNDATVGMIAIYTMQHDWFTNKRKSLGDLGNLKDYRKVKLAGIIEGGLSATEGFIKTLQESLLNDKEKVPSP